MTFFADSQTPTPSLFARTVNSVAEVAVVSIRAVLRTVKNRRGAASLSGLDDRMLADIGLTRGDLHDAYAEPVWRDPTAVLVSRVQERRVNRRRTITLSAKVFESPSIVPGCETAPRALVGARYY